MHIFALVTHYSLYGRSALEPLLMQFYTKLHQIMKVANLIVLITVWTLSNRVQRTQASKPLAKALRALANALS